MTAMARSGLRELALLPPVVVQLSAWPELEEAVGVASTALTPGARRWLTVAVAHRSALYERSRDFPGVSATCLTLLGSVGKAAVDVELRRAIAKAAPTLTAERRDQEANRVGPQLRRSLVRTLAVPRNALLGRGEAQELARRDAAGLSARTLEAVAYQVVGWWSLVLDGHRLRQFVDDLYVLAASTASAKAAEARTILDRYVDSAEFEIVRTGPDHAAMFRATVRTPDGRAGTAEAPTKKAAQHGASLDYLSRHLPHALTGKRPNTLGRGASGRRPSVPAVDQRLVELAAMFGCGQWEPFGRALTHRSWVFENTVNRDTERESNALLANLGSSVLSATTMRRRAANLLGQTSDPDPEVAVPVSVPDAALHRVFDTLGLQRLVRVGRGYHGRTLPDSMTSDMVQAVLAASHVQWQSHASFEDHLPDVVRGFLDEVTAVSLIDPFTRLQELAAELGFSIVVGDADRTGPDHQAVYTVALRIEGLSTPISVQASEGSKTAARKMAAAKILDSAALLSGGVHEHSNLALARALLVRQLAVLPGRRSRWPLWRRSGRLGVNLLLSDDASEFDRWSRATVRVLGEEWRPDADTTQALAQYYSEAQRAAGGRPKFATLLEEVADRIVELASGSDVSDALPLDDLVALSAAQSVWMSSGEDVTLSDVLEDWSTLNQRRCEMSVDAESPQVPVSACAGAALLKCLQECVTAARSAGQTLVVRGGRSGRRYDIIVQCGDRLSGMLAVSPRLQLITESAADLHLANDGDSIRLSVEISARTAGDSWLVAAARQARKTDDYDAELARLVHDLKNEITAAHVAARRPAATRTDRLEAQLAASRHLDTAGGLAARLRAADRLYAAADLVGETELGAFMQAYVSDLIRGIEGGIRVIPPAFLPVIVAVDEGALRAVLDNLVANAAAAMSTGGQIGLDYVTSPADGVVLLELTDTGAGLPEDVARALAAGRPSPSEKKQGSGLGLLGVQRLLGRVGGRLEPLDRPKGTGWLITLPIIDTPSEAESSA
jgi:signal transduction histidine kinase